MQLFDESIRTDGRPATHAESSYRFLNRSSWKVCGRARQLCNDWFSRFPDSDRRDLMRRFKSNDEAQHISAHFELLMHELLMRLGFAVTTHPTISTTSRRPDFLVESDIARFYLETTVRYSVSAKIEESMILRSIYDSIEEMASPYFQVSLEAVGTPAKQPPKRAFIEPIKRLMDDTDHLQAWRLAEAGIMVPPPHTTINFSDSYLEVELYPRPPHRWGDTANATIGTWRGGYVTSINADVRKAILDKAREKSVSSLDAPLVIACSTIDGFYNLAGDALETLFGLTEPGLPEDWSVDLNSASRSEGVWRDSRGRSRHSNLAGVWLFRNARPVGRTPTGIGDCLFPNPFVDDPMPDELMQVNHAQTRDGVMSQVRGTDLSSVLEVPSIPEDDLRRPADL